MLLLLILISFLICCKTGEKTEIKPDIQEEKTTPVDVLFQEVSRIDLPDLLYPYILATCAVIVCIIMCYIVAPRVSFPH